ncbi:MAG TPA: UbiA family prenyltransferase [Opitutaceae bacterium]|jgi:4-hydroxybenzoate polyprenyltransferase
MDGAAHASVEQVGAIRPPAPLAAVVSCLRFREILVMQAPPLMGLALAAGAGTPRPYPTMALFAAGSLLLVAFVWSLNDWADMRADRSNPNRPASLLAAGQVSGRSLLGLSLGMLAASLAVFAVLPGRTLLIAAAIAALGAAYSLSSIFVKGQPLVSSLLHFVGGILHFLLGYSVLSPLRADALALAPFFALVFMAGHATQEIQDWSADRANGIRTNAVAFGPVPVFACSCAAFAAAYAYFALLAVHGLVPRILLWPVSIAGVLQAICSAAALGSGLSFQSMHELRRQYRYLFAAIGACWVCARLLS